MMIPLAEPCKRFRAQLAYTKRWALYSHYYFDPTLEVSAKEERRKCFDLPPLIDKRSDSIYQEGRRCYYQQNGLVNLKEVVIAKLEFSGCVGAWPIPLIWAQGRGFTAEPQLTSSRAAMVFGRPKAVPNDKKMQVIAGEAFHLLGPYQSNWYHTLIDQLSLIARWQSLGLRSRGVRLIMPGLWAYRWPELSQLIGLEEQEIVWFNDEPIRVESILLPVGVRVRSSFPTPLAAVAQTFANPDDLLGLRQLLLARLAKPEDARSHRVVIDRSDAWRIPRTQHFAELSNELTRKYGFKRIVMGELRPSEQLKLFRDSEIVVAEHGAGLASFVVASPETVVVEVLPKHHLEVQAHGYNFIAHTLKHQAYHTIVDAPVVDLLPYIDKVIGQIDKFG